MYRGKPDTTENIPRSITFTPLHFMFYRGKSPLGQSNVAQPNPYFAELYVHYCVSTLLLNLMLGYMLLLGYTLLHALLINAVAGLSCCWSMPCCVFGAGP